MGCLCFPLTLWLSINIHRCGMAPCGSCFIIQAGHGSMGCPTHPPSVRAAQPLPCYAHHPRAGVLSLGHSAQHSHAKIIIKIKQSKITYTSRRELSFHWLSIFSQECTVSTQVNNAPTACQMVSHPEYITTTMNCRTFAPTNYLKSEQLITNIAVWLNGTCTFHLLSSVIAHAMLKATDNYINESNTTLGKKVPLTVSVIQMMSPVSLFHRYLCLCSFCLLWKFVSTFFV